MRAGEGFQRAIPIVRALRKLAGGRHGEVATPIIQQDLDKTAIEISGDNQVDVVVAVNVTSGDSKTADRTVEIDSGLRAVAELHVDGIVGLGRMLALHLHEGKIGFLVAVEVRKNKARFQIGAAERRLRELG